MFADSLLRDARRLLKLCGQKEVKVATAESCTGGLIAALLTEIPGSSSVVDRGFVTYSNAAKMEMLGVPKKRIEQYGAVSQEVADDMALGALKHSDADIAVSVTGIAGPGGGTKQKPVGLVYMAIAEGKKCTWGAEWHFKGDRPAVRARAVKAAIAALTARLGRSS